MTPQRHVGAQSARGFTLLEILVVMVLLGAATLIATGSAEPILRAARERGWIDRLQAELVRTRNYARASGAVAVVSFHPGEGVVRFARGPQTGELALPSGYWLETEGGNDGLDQTLVFFPDGSASDTEIVFALGAGRATRLRVAGATGKIELAPMEPPG